jgi:Nuclease-related domain.
VYLKKIQIPYHVQQYEVFSRRLAPPLIRADFESRYKRGMAGYRGEQSMEYPLSYLPEKEFLIFHNLRLFDGHHHFQIDFLILCSRFCTILEVKNIAGTLTFDTDFLQLVREQNQITDIFDDPISQVENLTNHLEEWLPVSSLPLMNRVVIASSAHIQATDTKNRLLRRIIRRANIKKEMAVLNKKYVQDHLDSGQLQRITARLLANHQPRIVDLFAISSVSRNDILKGVHCPDCGARPMIRRNRSWHCDDCGHKSAKAHLAALLDYYLIFGREITNRQCREFLLIDSATSAKKLLQSVSSHYMGEKRKRVYYLSFRSLVETSSEAREEPVNFVKAENCPTRTETDPLKTENHAAKTERAYLKTDKNDAHG